MQQVLLEAPPALLRRAVIHVLSREHVAGIELHFCKPVELSTPVRAVQAMALG